MIHTMEHSDLRQGPMSGVVVVDLSRVLAGPYCTMMLGDMGATVIKVEHPGVGDDTRHFGPPYVAGESAYYLGLNRNKYGITLDFSQPEGKERLLKLVKQADILVQNFRPGSLDRKGQHIDLSLFECAVTMLANIASNTLISGEEARRHGNAHANIIPYQSFHTRDGFIAVACGNDGLFRGLCRLLQRDDLVQDPRFATNSLRLSHREELISILNE